MNPLSEIEWNLDEHKNWLAEIETYHRHLGYERFHRGNSEAFAVRAMRTLIAVAAKSRQVVGATIGGSVARSVGNSNPEIGTNR
jgi:hypothetical protein